MQNLVGHTVPTVLGLVSATFGREKMGTPAAELHGNFSSSVETIGSMQTLTLQSLVNCDIEVLPNARGAVLLLQLITGG